MAASIKSHVLLSRLLHASLEVNRFNLKCSSRLTSPLPCCCISSIRSYASRRRRMQTEQNPRENVRYPYVPGDPLHEDAIKKLKPNSAIAALIEKDRIADRKKLQKVKENVTTSELESGLKFEKLGEGDVRLGKTIMATKSNNPKKSSNNIVLEGQRLISDALALGAEMKSLYFCDTEALNSFPQHHLKDVALYKIFPKVMKTWSDTATPSGLLGIFKKPQQGEALSPPETVLPITLIFDSLKDPGNAGTLIRTAAAIGCQRIIATRGSVNVWEGKVLRSAMGGHFSIPIYTGLGWSDVDNYLEDNTQVFLANSRPAHVLGRAFDTSIQIEDLEDLNNEVDENSDSELTEKQRQQIDEEAEKDAYDFHKFPFNVYDYSDISLNPPEITPSTDTNLNHSVSVALVLGGETEGLSAQAKKFAYRHYGHYVTIPMNSCVNSLNTGIAGSIILYELRRKLMRMEIDPETVTGR